MLEDTSLVTVVKSAKDSLAGGLGPDGLKIAVPAANHTNKNSFLENNASYLRSSVTLSGHWERKLVSLGESVFKMRCI